MSFGRPAGLAGLSFVAQGIAFDIAGACLRLTDPLTVTIQVP